MYADDNDDRIVNGATGCSNRRIAWSDHRNELAWVDTGPISSILTGSIQVQEGIRDGALWPYVKDLRMYRYPTRRPGEVLTYAIMFSMNGVCHDEVREVPGAYIKKRSEIHNLAHRLVFIDEGKVTPDAFAVHYKTEQWWDGPPVRDSDGTIVSFADGHSEHWKWKGIDTIKRGKEVESGHSGSWTPETDAGFQDLYRIQKDCWGRLVACQNCICG